VEEFELVEFDEEALSLSLAMRFGRMRVLLLRRRSFICQEAC
jgi:hypothetical protein